MHKYILRSLLFIFSFLVLSETLSRLVIDPLYYYSLNTYNQKKEDPSISDMYKSEPTSHVDYLFIGSSRVPATINAKVFMKHDPRKVAVVAGRGYMTAGIHHQALKHRLAQNPEYLKNTKVFIEYPGSGIYTEPFSNDRFRVYEPIEKSNKPMPHLLLPHLDFKSLLAFIKESKNSLRVKLNLVLQYSSATYRTSLYVKEKVGKLSSYYLLKETDSNLVAEGGIRNDNIQMAKELVVLDAALQIERMEEAPMLSTTDLNRSSLAALHMLITQNGGSLFLYKVPLTSIQENIHRSDKAIQNKTIFEKWATSKGIKIISNDTFSYTDSDFPDAWHLSKDRRDEFSSLLYNEITEGI